MKKARLTWTIKKMVDMYKSNNITFENAVQRSLVWDTDRKSLLIHSVISDFPIPAFYSRKANKKYDMLDGKQRCNTFISFMNDEFALSNIPEITLDDEDGGDTIDLNGKTFSTLDENIKSLITDFALDVYYFEDISDDQVAEIFFRINNGKPLSAIELTRCKAKSMKEIIRIGSHELFKNSLTSKALERYTNEDLVIKTYIMLHESEPCLDTKVIRPIMESTIITEQDESQINEVYNRILNAYNLIEDKKIAKRMLSKTHMVSIVPFVWKSICDGMSDQQFAEWFQSFFCGKKSATNNEVYNKNALRGTGKKDTIRKRIAELEKSWNAFFTDFYSYYGTRKNELSKKPEADTDISTDAGIKGSVINSIIKEDESDINVKNEYGNSNNGNMERSENENVVDDIDTDSEPDPDIESFIDSMIEKRNQESVSSQEDDKSYVSSLVDEIVNGVTPSDTSSDILSEDSSENQFKEPSDTSSEEYLPL